MDDADASLASLAAGLRSQIAELDKLCDASEAAASLRCELLAALRECSAAEDEDAGGAAEDGVAKHELMTPPPRRLVLVPHSGAAGNAGHHPRSCFAAGAPDFGALASLCPRLAPHVTSRHHGAPSSSPRHSLDFTDWAACEALTGALFLAAFGVSWRLPRGRLVPTLPSRCNYIHWLEDVVRWAPGTRPLRCLDVGTGASLVYPLIAASLHADWTFVATDCDDESLAAASELLTANPQLRGRVELRSSRGAPSDAAAGGDAAAASSTQHRLLAGVVRPGEVFDFSMCNPPFFGDASEAGQGPGADCGGRGDELVTPGGEGSFVSRMAAESATEALRTSVEWFSTLLGKKATLKALAVQLRAFRPQPRVVTTTFQQGRTTRWGVAWSFFGRDANNHPRPATAPLTDTPAPSSACPCARASVTLRVGRAGAGAVMALLLEAATSAGAERCATPTAAPPVDGSMEALLELPMHAGESGAGNGDAAPAGKRRRLGDGGEASVDALSPPAAAAAAAPAPPKRIRVRASLMQANLGELVAVMRIERPARGAPSPGGAGAGAAAPHARAAAEAAFGFFTERVAKALRGAWPGA